VDQGPGTAGDSEEWAEAEANRHTSAQPRWAAPLSEPWQDAPSGQGQGQGESKERIHLWVGRREAAGTWSPAGP
jgi:hypothetical protein